MPPAPALTSFTIFFSIMGLGPRRTAEQVTSTLQTGVEETLNLPPVGRTN